MNLPIELKTRIYEHIGIVQQHLGELPSDEQREILQSLETHIHDALENRAGGEPSMEFLEAILAEMDPPESYGSEHHPAATQSHPDKETPTLSGSGSNAYAHMYRRDQRLPSSARILRRGAPLGAVGEPTVATIPRARREIR